MDNPRSAAAEIARSLNERCLILDNWINVTDVTTNTFLYAAAEMDLNFKFLEAYAHCRVKPLTRALTGGVRHAVHWRDDSASPPSVPWPLIAKPITGTGSEGVTSAVNGGQWENCLKRLPKNDLIADIGLHGFYPGRQFLVEERLSGTEYEIDGFVHDDNLQLCTVGYKIHDETAAGFREIGGLTYRWNGLSERSRVDSAIERWTGMLLRRLGFAAF